MKLTPTQKDVDYDRPSPEEAAKCKIYPKRIDGHVGWIIEDPNGVILRKFVDTNGDNVVDQWSYYKDGIEVYRDIDSDFNGKVDQCRWLNTAGCRWGLDKKETGKIDAWKMISAEEVKHEVVAALANQDVDRFMRLALSPAELKNLGLSEKRTHQLADKLQRLAADFTELLSQQKAVTSATKWVQFGDSQPGAVPAGTDGSTADLVVYENVVAVTETAGKHGQVQIGTLIRVGDAWRLIDVPRPQAEGQAEPAAVAGFFFHPQTSAAPARPATAGPGDAAQKLLTELETLDKTAGNLSTAEQRADYNAKRADLVEKIAEQTHTAQEREMWYRQLADMIGAAVQSGSYPEGVKRLEELFERLKKNASPEGLVAYVRFRSLSADFGAQDAEPWRRREQDATNPGRMAQKPSAVCGRLSQESRRGRSDAPAGHRSEYAGRRGQEVVSPHRRGIPRRPDRPQGRRCPGAPGFGRSGDRLPGPERDRRAGRSGPVPRQGCALAVLGHLVRAVQGRNGHSQGALRQVRSPPVSR